MGCAVALRTQKAGMFLVNTAAQWLAGIHPRTEETTPRVKRSHYKQILHRSLRFQIHEHAQTHQIFLCLLKQKGRILLSRLEGLVIISASDQP